MEGGTATFLGEVVEDYTPDAITTPTPYEPLVYILTITLEGTADGTEVITVSPKVEEGEENDVYYIFDQIGNGAIANQTNGTVPVKDKTPPLLVNDADPVETGVVFTEISTNEWPLESGNKYFKENQW